MVVMVAIDRKYGQTDVEVTLQECTLNYYIRKVGLKIGVLLHVHVLKVIPEHVPLHDVTALLEAPL
jgi:hypothetical protein